MKRLAFWQLAFWQLALWATGFMGNVERLIVFVHER